ncbi:PD40 domain-containing protein [Aquimarina brevivitae]|uniref:WD40 repeat protein n=1 Tax=Aquimarina brevivitae TaxID=323412 RepID=A0A4Q7PGG9_9FLAO|nr:PD40 domain-containing protein [Aquimarina brevivitae]RZS99465.1 WD40 repeat protein [Aquimarina brevivitae]
MKFPFLLLVLCGTLSYGQLQFSSAKITDSGDTPENYTGIVVENYADGHPKLWRQEKNGKADGLWQEWYPNGKLRYRAWWKNGLGNGKWEYFYPNGQLRSASFYIKDIAQGIMTSYHENGQIAQQSVYIDGRLDGIVYDYDANGIILSRKRYANGSQIIDEPVLFQPGVIATETANEWDITFTPDGNKAYFTRRLLDNTPQKIYQTVKDSQGNWSTPIIASFSTDRDEGAFITPNGQYFFFASCRPMDKKAPDNTLDMNIWMMTKTAIGWSSPKPLPDTINKRRTVEDAWPKHYEAGPSMDRNGHLFYWTKSSVADVANLYQTIMQRNSTFSQPLELIPPSQNNGYDSGPVVSPDGNLLFFVSSNRSESYGREDLYFSRLKEGIWSEPKNLGPVVNSDHNEGTPRFSPDGKYFFFSSDRGDNFDSSGERIWSIYFMETQFLILD